MLAIKVSRRRTHDDVQDAKQAISKVRSFQWLSKLKARSSR